MAVGGKKPKPRARRPASGAAKRAAWGSISREQVIDAAMRTVRAGRYEDMTIRGLATDLGVAPMSLYRHVKDKNDLLNEIVSRLLAEVWQPAAQQSEWRAWIIEAANRLRQFLVDQPAALHVYLEHPVVSAPAVERMEVMVAVLRRVTQDDEAAHRAYAAIHTYTVGFAALEAAREMQQHIGEEIAEGLAGQLAAYITPAQFLTGLEYLIEGILHNKPSGTREATSNASASDKRRT